MTTYEIVTVPAEGSTLSAVLWRRFRRPMPGLVERVLDEHPGLAGDGLLLPAGTVLRVPVSSAPTRAAAKTVRIWD